MAKLVSVITPTWQRHELLLNRCMPSVQEQTYPDVQHVVISDGPDPGLARQVWQRWDQLSPDAPLGNAIYDWLPTHHGTYGGPARRRACELATGDYIAYLDDDDAYRNDHVELLAAALDLHPEVGFVHSGMLAHLPDGHHLSYEGPPGVMLGTPMIMHRRELLDLATWGAGEDEDTVLVQAWLDAGVDYGTVSMTTVDVFPGPATTAAIMRSREAGSIRWE